MNWTSAFCSYQTHWLNFWHYFWNDSIFMWGQFWQSIVVFMVQKGSAQMEVVHRYINMRGGPHKLMSRGKYLCVCISLFTYEHLAFGHHCWPQRCIAHLETEIDQVLSWLCSSFCSFYADIHLFSFRPKMLLCLLIFNMPDVIIPVSLLGCYTFTTL